MHNFSELSKRQAAEFGPYLSRASAASKLHVSTESLDRLAALHGVRTFQVPGHSRKLYHQADVEKLVAEAAGLEARA